MSKKRGNGTGTLFKRTPRGAWIAKWIGADGRYKEHSTRTTDRAAAERILGKMITDAALRRDGVIDARIDRRAAENRRPLAEHIADWQAALTAKGVTAKQVRLVVVRTRALVSALKAESLSDLTPAAVQTTLGDLRTGSADTPGLSLQTLQHYLRAIKQFSRWLHRDGRTADDALAHLGGYNAETDRQYVRRALDAAELTAIVEAAEHGPDFRGVSGADRAMLYRTAMGTGFRAAELASLTPEAFDLDADTPVIRLQAGSSKRRRADVQPIHPTLADALAEWLDGKPAGAPVWPGTWSERAAAMLRGDMDAARQAWLDDAPTPEVRQEREESAFLKPVDDAGRTADFHALRTSYVTMLIKSGVSAKVVQQLARHSDPALTLNTYCRLGVVDTAGALAHLPDLVTLPEQEAAAATGTDGRIVETPNDTPMTATRKHASGAIRGETKAARNRPAPTAAAAPKTPNSSRICGGSPRKGGSGAVKISSRARSSAGQSSGFLNRISEIPSNAAASSYDHAENGPQQYPNDQPMDADLARVVAAWPTLAESARLAILSLIGTA